VGVLLGSDVVQLDDVAALHAALDGALTGNLRGLMLVSRGWRCGLVGSDWIGRSYGQPVNLVGVDGETSAAGVLLITSTGDDDGILECACIKTMV
jgi:hypothetical protein